MTCPPSSAISLTTCSASERPGDNYATDEILAPTEALSLVDGATAPVTLARLPEVLRPGGVHLHFSFLLLADVLID